MAARGPSARLLQRGGRLTKALKIVLTPTETSERRKRAHARREFRAHQPVLVVVGRLHRRLSLDLEEECFRQEWRRGSAIRAWQQDVNIVARRPNEAVSVTLTRTPAGAGASPNVLGPACGHHLRRDRLYTRGRKSVLHKLVAA